MTHRIIENDDWTVEEKRHVTRTVKMKQPAEKTSTTTTTTTDGVIMLNDTDNPTPAASGYEDTKSGPDIFSVSALVPTKDSKDKGNWVSPF